MKNFFGDLWNVQKETFGFVKKHPVGYTVFTLGCGLIGAAVTVVPYMIEQKKREKELEKMMENLDEETKEE